MKKKILIISFLLTSSIVFLPSQAVSATVASFNGAVSTTKPQIRVRIGGQNDRRRHRRWQRQSRIVYYNYYRPGYIRQVYYVGGRPRYRWYRRD